MREQRDKNITRITRFSIYGIIATLGLVVIFAGLFYSKYYVEAYRSITASEETVDYYKDKGMSVSYYEKSLKDKKGDLKSFLSYTQLENFKEYAKNIEKNVEKDYKQKLEEVKNSYATELEEFQNILLETDNIYIPSRLEMENFAKEYALKVGDAQKNIQDYNEYITQIKERRYHLDQEVNEAQKRMLLENLQDLYNDSKELLTYFNSKAGYNTEKQNLKVYQTKFQELRDSQFYKNLTFAEFQNILEQDYYPLVNSPKEVRQKIDEAIEKKRQDLINKEAEKRAKYNLGPAPKPPLEKEKLIYIHKASQRLYAYDKGDLILSTPITTGMNGHATPSGTFKIYYKNTNTRLRSPFPDEYYDLAVDYWMPFYEGYGLHDACNSRSCWRTVFGGQDYKWNGSHGCVNTPYEAVKTLYGWAEIGTTVYVK